jgi:hypothetical protein
MTVNSDDVQALAPEDIGDQSIGLQVLIDRTRRSQVQLGEAACASTRD